MTVKPDGNGGQRLTFAPRTWLAFFACSLTCAALVGSIMWGAVKLQIRAELALHSVAPHPSTEQRLQTLETK